jgi:Tfp pilus assembly protein PilE
MVPASPSIATSNRGRLGRPITPIELMIAIIGTLAAIAIPSFNPFQAHAKQSEGKSKLRTVFTTRRSQYQEKDRYLTPSRTRLPNASPTPSTQRLQPGVGPRPAASLGNSPRVTSSRRRPATATTKTSASTIGDLVVQAPVGQPYNNDNDVNCP